MHDFLTARTLFAKFWWTFFLLSLIGVALYASLLSSKWTEYVALRAQIVHWKSAETIKNHFFKDREKISAFAEVPELLRNASNLYPAFDFYVYLPQKSKIISDESIQDAQIGEKPLSQFTKLRHFPSRPIYLNERKFDHLLIKENHIFSAANINIMGQEGYLIVILIGKRYARLEISDGEIPAILGLSLFLSVVMICSIAALLVYLLILRRLKNVTTAIASCTEGDYSTQLIDKENDEISMHVTAFNTMASTIKTLIGELTRQDSLRRELVANVSHELRRPLTTLQLTMETLIENVDKANSPAYLEQALACCQELSGLIEDLFELSCLDSKEKIVESSLFDLKEMCVEIIDSFNSRDRKILFVDCGYLERYLVRADEALIQRAMSNLIENAIKYSDTKDEIEIRLCLEGNRIAITISDTGTGIEEADMPFVFERFFRGRASKKVDKSDTKVQTGAGLGLAIVKRILELHGSIVTLSSVPGVRTEFGFSLVSAG